MLAHAVRDGVGVTEIRLPDLRHTQATIPCWPRCPCTWSVVTMTAYAHMLLGGQREGLVGGCPSTNWGRANEGAWDSAALAAPSRSADGGNREADSPVLCDESEH